jgi:spermidine synthase
LEPFLFLTVLVVGFSGIVAEVVLFREFFIVFSGNELSMGIVIGNWLLLQAAGSYIAGRKPKWPITTFFRLIIATVPFSLSVPAGIFIIRTLKSLLGSSVGESITLPPLFYSSILLRIPRGFATEPHLQYVGACVKCFSVPRSLSAWYFATIDSPRE